MFTYPRNCLLCPFGQRPDREAGSSFRSRSTSKPISAPPQGGTSPIRRGKKGLQSHRRTGFARQGQPPHTCRPPLNADAGNSSQPRTSQLRHMVTRVCSSLEATMAHGENSRTRNRRFRPLRKELVDTLGPETARRLLLRFGFADGYHDAVSLRDRSKWASPEDGLRAGAMLHPECASGDEPLAAVCQASDPPSPPRRERSWPSRTLLGGVAAT